MANLPEKNITTVSAITSIPSNTNIFVNANGQFGQASIDNVVKASNVVSDATLGAMKEFIDLQFQVLTGSPILAQGTEDGYMPSFTGKGGSEQNSYSGYQLFDASKLPTASVGGATVTNNGDGSFTISGSGNLTSIFSRQYTYSADEAVKLLKVGQCTLKSEAVTMPYISFVLYDTESNSVFKQLDNSNSTKSSIDITEEIMTNISNGKYSVKLFIYGSSGLAINPGTIKLMLYQDGDGTWEPFTGAQPSPNPSYPQPIKSKGDCGWFDGELLKGYYNSTDGSHVSADYYVCNKTKIPCKANDEIKLTYENIVGLLEIDFFDENNVRISASTSKSSNEVTAIAPANASYCVFCINDSTMTLSKAQQKKIVVTINDTYAVKVKSVGRNFFGGLEFANALVSSGADATLSTESKIVILHGNSNSKKFEYVGDFKENTQYTIFFRGINNDTDYLNHTNMTVEYTDGSTGSLRFDTSNKQTYFVTDSSKTVAKLKGLFETGIAKFYYEDFGIQEGVCTLEDFEPYKEHTEWIPLSEPLRENDTIECIDGVYGVVRGSEYGRITSVTKNNTDTNDYLYYQHFDDKKRMTTVKCNTLIDRYLHNLIGGNTIDKVGITGRGDNNVIYINVGYYLSKDGYENTVSAMNTWLSENPTYVEYELAEPTFEPFADQSPFYRLKTFEGVTHISATDDMEMEIEVPTSRAGGVASIGWSKGNLAQIETQNLSAKIAELQTAIVNM